MDASNHIKSFFQNYPQRVFEDEELLLRPGDGEMAFYIEGGVVLQYDISENGEKLVVNMYKAGSILSLPCVLTGNETNFFFESDGHVTARIASRLEVDQFLRNNTDVLYDTLVRMARGADGLLLRVACMMEGGAESRILYELEVLRARFPTEDGEIHVTMSELSAQTGLARETVSRAVKKMRASGVITTSRGRFTIND